MALRPFVLSVSTSSGWASETTTINPDQAAEGARAPRARRLVPDHQPGHGAEIMSDPTKEMIDNIMAPRDDIRLHDWNALYQDDLPDKFLRSDVEEMLCEIESRVRAALTYEGAALDPVLEVWRHFLGWLPDGRNNGQPEKAQMNKALAESSARVALIEADKAALVEGLEGLLFIHELAANGTAQQILRSIDEILSNNKGSHHEEQQR